jgi:cytochrome c-type biogenesis protein
VGAASLFVLGFSLVFAALGATASYIGAALSPYHVLLTRLAGVFVILMALFLLGRWSIPALYTERRLQIGRDFGVWSAFPLGMAFAFGWSPCIGPVLTSIMALAVTEASAQRGALLLFVYGLGLGAPFLLAALFTGQVLSGLSPFKRHYMAIERTGGAILLVMGVFLVMNRWTAVLGPFLNWYSDNVHLPM